MPSTRRDFLSSSVFSTGRNGAYPSDDPAPTPSMEEHAAHRLQFGPRYGDVEQIESMGYIPWLEQQFSPFGIDDSACDAIAATHPNGTFNETWAQLYDRRSQTYSTAAAPFHQVRHRTMVRMIHSKRQVYERLVDFWHNHFNVYGNDFLIRSLFTKWDDTIRTHAFGNFRSLLEATVTHPVMLYYLDNYLNESGNPNENYARELLELHTMGEEHYSKLLFDNYDPATSYIDWDVYALRLILTGFTYEESSSSPNRGQFKIVEADHSRELKIFLKEIFEPNQNAATEVGRALNMIAQHPAVATHICTKLIRRFVSYDVPQRLLDEAVATWLATWQEPSQIALVLGLILRSPEFADPAIRMSKVKRPIDWIISTYRALNLTYQSNNDRFWNYFDPMGSPHFQWRPPDGAPDEFDYYATSTGLIQRWNMMNRVASGWDEDDGIEINVSAVTPTYTTPRQIADYWITRVAQRPVSEATRYALTEYIAEGRNWDFSIPPDERTYRTIHTAALATMAPEFNRY